MSTEIKVCLNKTLVAIIRRILKQVMKHNHLAITIPSCPDSDRRNRQFGSDQRSYLLRHKLQYYGASTCLFQSLGILKKSLRIELILALDTISTNLIHGLRGQTNMTDNRNTRLHDGLHRSCNLLTAFHLHCMSMSFLHKSANISQRLIYTSVI
ncbi:hypothetical protein D3C73_1110380 [compost metagenome]